MMLHIFDCLNENEGVAGDRDKPIVFIERFGILMFGIYDNHTSTYLTGLV